MSLFFAHGFVFYYTSMSSLPRSDQVSGVSRQINHDELFMRQRKKKKNEPHAGRGKGMSKPGEDPLILVGGRLFATWFMPCPDSIPSCPVPVR